MPRQIPNRKGSGARPWIGVNAPLLSIENTRRPALFLKKKPTGASRSGSVYPRLCSDCAMTVQCLHNDGASIIIGNPPIHRPQAVAAPRMEIDVGVVHVGVIAAHKEYAGLRLD